MTALIAQKDLFVGKCRLYVDGVIGSISNESHSGRLHGYCCMYAIVCLYAIMQPTNANESKKA